MSYRNCRMRAGLSMAEAADRIGTEMHTVQQWEIGIRQPRADSIKKMAAIYGVTADQLLADEKELRRSAEKTRTFLWSIDIQQAAQSSGIPTKTLYGLQEVHRVPKWQTLRKLCTAFRLEIASFLEEVPDDAMQG